MSKKRYNGLVVKYVPVAGADIVAASACQIVSVQYYIDPNGAPGVCVTDTPGEGYEVGYSNNWNQRPTGA